ncbi:tyrosine-protein phosphatase [Microbacterium sp. KR10-403]|uniref:tyrosine-protein phosphatase n=1 Tax=Microbacterium sp. KR10-403 TaxID=3158581 RepID=UPI0032E444B2
MQRDLTWHGGRNVRDLGGLPTTEGATTIPNRVARSARRELLTEQGWRDAAAWGLRSIVDLRIEAETGSREGDPAARAPEHVTITLAPTEDQQNSEFVETCFPILDSPEYWAHNVRILPDLVRTTLEAIAHAEPGILFHCSAGRDRTGLISTLLLANAGVTVDAIVTDYALGVRAMAGAGANGAATHDRQATWTDAETDAFLAEVTPHVVAFADDIDGVLDRLEIGLATRAALRELLTE